MESGIEIMKKRVAQFLVLLFFWAQFLLPAVAYIADNTTEVRLSAVSGNPFPTQTQTAVTSLSLNSGPIKLFQNNVWVPYLFGGQTITVASDYGMFHSVFVKPGTSAGTLTYEDDPWLASAITATISSATAATPCVLTLTAAPNAAFVAGAQVMIAQGTGTGTLYTDTTYGLSGARCNAFTIASVSGSTITLTGTNTSALSVSGASGGIMYLVPSANTNVPTTVQDGVIVQTSNKAARLIGTYLTGAGGISGQTEFSAVRQMIFNQKDASLSQLQNIVYAALGTTNAPASPIICCENNLYIYTQSLAPNSDSSGSSSTLYAGGLNNNVQTFYDGIGTFYNVICSQLAITMSGNTAGLPVDVYGKGGGIGSNSYTTSQTNWTSATVPPTRGVDPAGRLCKNGDTSSLLIGSYVPLSATTTQDDPSAHDVFGVLTQRTKNFYAAPTANASTSSTTFVAEGASTTNGVGRVAYFEAVPISPINFTYTAYVTNNTVGAQTFIGIGINSTTIGTVAALYSQLGTGGGDTIALNYILPPPTGSGYAQKLFAVTSSTGNVVATTTVSSTVTPLSYLRGFYQG